MALRQIHARTEAGEELRTMEKTATALVSGIADIAVAGLAFFQKIDTNADGLFNNPGDRDEALAVLVQLKADIKAAADSL